MWQHERSLAILVGIVCATLVACSISGGNPGEEGDLRDVLTPLATAVGDVPTNTPQPAASVGVPEATVSPLLSTVGPPTAEPASPQTTATPLKSLGYGMQIHGCGYPVDPALDLIVEAGFDWVKQQVRWEEVEPELLEPDWSCIDRVVDGAEARGLKVLLSVTTSPTWSRSGRESGHPDILPLFGQFCLRMVERYRGRVHAVEVFNEPNLDREWGDYLDPFAYTTLLEWAYAGIKQADPGVIVISAGLAPTRWNDWAVAIDDQEYLSQMGEAHPERFVDCIGTHFNHGTSSPLAPGGEFETQMMDYFDAFGGQVPLCVTEFGFATPDRTGGHLPQGFEWAASTSAEEQAKWLVDGFQWAREHPDVMRLVIVWNLNYHSDDADDPNVPYALWFPPPRGLMPAYHALSDMVKER
jgi:hypothetical protein